MIISTPQFLAEEVTSLRTCNHLGLHVPNFTGLFFFNKFFHPRVTVIGAGGCYELSKPLFVQVQVQVVFNSYKIWFKFGQQNVVTTPGRNGALTRYIYISSVYYYIYHQYNIQ